MCLIAIGERMYVGRKSGEKAIEIVHDITATRPRACARNTPRSWCILSSSRACNIYTLYTHYIAAARNTILAIQENNIFPDNDFAAGV